MEFIFSDQKVKYVCDVELEHWPHHTFWLYAMNWNYELLLCLTIQITSLLLLRCGLDFQFSSGRGSTLHE